MPRFRLTPLVKLDLGISTNVDFIGTMGINNKGQVVYGYKSESEAIHAWLWLPEADYGLNSGFHDLTDLSESDTPAMAHDINDDTWIVARGREISQPQDTYAFLLTPFPEFPEGVSGDGCVNVTDWLAVIGTWGNCPIGAICHADVNGDCVVNVTDLLAVNAAWGQGCPENFSGNDPAPSLEEQIVMVLEAPISSETQSEIIQALLANWN